MKEHFNSVNPMLDSVKGHGLYKPNFSRSPLGAEKKSLNDPLTDNSLVGETDDLFSGRLHVADGLADEVVDQMDLSAALDSINFIRDLGTKPEGRSMMSNAHKNVDPGEVIKLFGI